MSRMTRFDWLAHQPRRRSQSLPRHDRRLRVEALEDRRMLAAVTVTNDLDLVNGDTSSIANLIASDGGDGISLREALDAANSTAGADVVDFDTGLAGGTINLAGTHLTISDDLTLTGLGADQLTIDAGGSSRVMQVTDGTVGISGLTLSGGSADRGGGLRNYVDATTTLTEVVIQGNQAVTTGNEAGGGIWNAGDLTIVGSTVAGNMAPNGTADGGGVSSNNTLTISSSTFSGNSAASAGGGVFNGNGMLTITNSTLTGNTASLGGGVSNFNGTLTITHSTLTGNAAGSVGGGVDSGGFDSAATITHSLISGNTATSGSEIIRESGTFNLDYNLLGDNSKTTAQALFNVAAGATDITSTNDGSVPTALAAILNPTLADNDGPTLTHALVAGSPAINAGDPLFVGPPNTDQRGIPYERVADGAIDIGAYEVQTLGPLVVDTLIDESDGDYSAGDFSLREALELAKNSAADTVTFDGSLAGGTINLTLGQLTISDDVTLTGLGADLLTINAGASSRVMRITGATTANISGLTFTGGVADRGGGLRNYAGATTTLTDVVIQGNTASTTGGNAGGGIWNAGNLTIVGSTVSGNMAPGGVANGGGVWSNNTLTISNSTLSGNSAAYGGGVYNSGGMLTVTNSTITGNSAAATGGGFGQFSGSTTISHSLISGNTALTASETFRYGGTFTLNDYNLIGDSSKTTAQALSGLAAGATDITATSDGSVPTALAAILDTTFAANGGPTLTHALVAGSPAINAGDPLFVGPPNTDQRGTQRVADGTIDIGAYEVQTLGPLVVDTLIDESNGDYSAGDFSLREALELAFISTADTVTFDGSLAGGTINLTLGQLTIRGDLTLTGLGADQLTIDAGGSSRVMQVIGAATDANVTGLTFTGGVADRGGGLRNYAGATTTLTDVVIQGNTANATILDAGGGIWNAGNLTIVRSTVSGNMAPGGSARGGGVYNSSSGTLTITNSTLTGNTASLSGGGVHNDGTLTITNSTLSGNTAVFFGGGVYNGGGTLTITNSTLTGNAATSSGGGIHHGMGVATTIGHSLIAGNTAPMASEIWRSALTVNLNDHNLIGDSSKTTAQALFGVTAGATDITATGDGSVPTALASILGPLADNGGPTLTHALLPGSPALDAGNPAAMAGMGGVPDDDQRGMPFARVADGDLLAGAVIDIGAYEAQSAPSADYMDDDVITGLDFLAWQIGFGITSGAVRADGNSDDDGDVDGSDLAAWEATYGQVDTTPLVAAFSTPLSPASSPAAVSPVPQNAAVQPFDRGELADLALAVELATEVAVDEAPLPENQPSATGDTGADTSPHSITARQTSESADEGPLAASSTADDEAATLWLTDELLEQVFG